MERITAVHIVSDTPGNISFAFSNNSEKEPVNVIIEKANGGGEAFLTLPTTGDIEITIKVTD